MTSLRIARVFYKGREYNVDLNQRRVEVRIPHRDGGKAPILRRIDWHGKVGRAVRLRASHAAQ